MDGEPQKGGQRRRTSGALTPSPSSRRHDCQRVREIERRRKSKSKKEKKKKTPNARSPDHPRGSLTGPPPLIDSSLAPTRGTAVGLPADRAAVILSPAQLPLPAFHRRRRRCRRTPTFGEIVFFPPKEGIGAGVDAPPAVHAAGAAFRSFRALQLGDSGGGATRIARGAGQGGGGQRFVASCSAGHVNGGRR